MNVLVVEDEYDIGVLIGVWLGQDADVRVRSCAEDVTDDDIEWAEACLVDYRLPGVDGCTLLGRVWSRKSSVRRVMWTAIDQAEPCPFAEAVLAKPNSLEQVMEALHGTD